MSTTVATERNTALIKKYVSISSKRQITIPQMFFDLLGFDSEAECIVRGDELIVRPAKREGGGEFAEYILADLIAQGLSGGELLKEFKNRQSMVRPAVEAMIADADAVAVGKGKYATYDEVFNSGDDE